MDVVERASPPGFIVDACRCIELCLTGGNLSETVRVDPELLRKLRSGRGTMSEIETVQLIFFFIVILNHTYTFALFLGSWYGSVFERTESYRYNN